MYGFSPKAIMEKLAKVPPENTSKSDNSGLPANNACRWVLSIPAAGIWATNLKTNKITAVINIFRRISGELTALEKNWAILLNIFYLFGSAFRHRNHNL